jgi:putative ABC transport system permease protein
MIVRRGLSLALSGVALGVGVALLVTRLLQSLLFEVEPSDPASYLAAALLLAAVAVVTSGVPAWRATRLNPNDALRGE